MRLANLRFVLHARRDAVIVVVGEAAGWRGARYSGLPLLSERLIDEATTPLRRTSTRPAGYAEASATIVQGVLRDRGAAAAVLLWNVVPTHPQGATHHSNRGPRAAEIAAGGELLADLLDIVRPAHVVALGRTAAAALPPALGAAAVRHPAQGGATACRAALGTLLAAWLPPASPAT